MRDRFSSVRWLSVVFVLALSVFPLSALKAQETSKEQAAELAGLLQDYRSFESSFIQIVVNENGNQVQETRGKLKAKRPGLFYWETTSPHSQYIVSDGNQVKVYDPDLEQVTIHDLDDRAATTPALLLSGQVDNLNEKYQVSSSAEGGANREFTLQPRNQDSLFLSLTLTFSGDRLQEMRMRDSLGQLSVLSFMDVTINGSIPEQAFTLDYPDSVDVIGKDT